MAGEPLAVVDLTLDDLSPADSAAPAARAAPGAPASAAAAAAAEARAAAPFAAAAATGGRPPPGAPRGGAPSTSAEWPPTCASATSRRGWQRALRAGSSRTQNRRWEISKASCASSSIVRRPSSGNAVQSGIVLPPRVRPSSSFQPDRRRHGRSHRRIAALTAMLDAELSPCAAPPRLDGPLFPTEEGWIQLYKTRQDCYTSSEGYHMW